MNYEAKEATPSRFSLPMISQLSAIEYELSPTMDNPNKSNGGDNPRAS